MKEVFAQRYVTIPSGQLERVEVHAPGVVQNPHDPQAQWSAKGHGAAKKDWVGYKVQVAESFEDAASQREEGEPKPHFLTSIVTQDAIESDEAGLAATFEQQRAAGLESPSELYVDGAYICAAALTEAAQEQRELLGPAQPSAARAGLDPAFRIEAFEIDVNQRRAVCPAGHENTQCSRLEEKDTGKVSYRFEFSTHCHSCALKEQCVGAAQKHRTLVVGEHHNHLQARRREQQSANFQERMHQRNAIEGTQSELVRAHGLRRARYRGKAKVDLQNQLIGTACNIKRWIKVMAWELRQRAEDGCESRLQTAMAMP
ncbi:MAG: transposase [Pseudomonadota bacterium]|nr:transposase [Pseudomonadota bacterium]